MRLRTLLVVPLLPLLALPAAAETRRWSFDTGAGGRLEVDLDTGGDVEIRGGGGGTVSVEATPSGRDADRIEIEAAATGGGVRVHSRYAGHARNTSGGVDVVVTVPDHYDLTLSSMGGAFRVTGVTGTITGTTMGGAIDLHEVGGEVELTTMGGAVRVTDTDADGEVKTMGGEVRMRNVRGGLRGKSMGGQVVVEDGGGNAEVVRISTMGGPIHLREAPAGAEVETMGGEIRIDSADGPVDAKTMGGEIEIGAASSDVKAVTMAGDVSVRVVGAGGDVEIESNAGDIELTLPAGFAASFDVELAYTRNSDGNYRIESDFPLTERRTESWDSSHGTPRKTIYAKGGSGGNRVQVRTINGDVTIREGG